MDFVDPNAPRGGFGHVINPAAFQPPGVGGAPRGNRGRMRGRGRGRANANPPVGGGVVEQDPVGNRERLVDGLVTNPGFWATVFTTLRHNPAVAEQIRRDLEQEEGRAARARDEAHVQENRPPGEDDDGEQAPRPAGEVYGERPPRVVDLPDLYDYMGRGFENIRRTAPPVQRLDLLMDELDIEALWSPRDVVISFGPLTRMLLRLFTGPYATDEENLIVRMLNLGLERAARNFGFTDYRRHNETTAEPFFETYRRRGRVLRDFAAFRYMLEVAENMGRMGRKHKNDLILLYLTLTTPEVRLHRRWNADDREHVIAFRDRVTGFPISTPHAVARPMSIEMHLDSVFGNVTSNTRLLERSIVSALNNRNRRVNGLNAAQEVELLLGGDTRLLDLSTEDGGVPTATARSGLKPYSPPNEQAALRHMLETSVIVSMMAEEYRVFVAGAPPSRCGDEAPARGARSNRRQCSETRRSSTRQPTMFRRPIFYTFKPTSQAVSAKER